MTSILWVSSSASSGGNGSADSPFKTIQAALDAATPGTVIQVKAGTYTENLVIRKNGTAEAPITLVSVDGPGQAVIKPKSQSKDTINIDGADHIAIRDFKIQGPSEKDPQAIHIHVATGNNFAQHILIENNTILRGAGDGIKGSKAEYVTLKGNTIQGGGSQESGIDFVGVRHSTLVGNKVLNSGNIGIMLKGGSEDIRVIDNVVDGARASGIEVGGYAQEHTYWPGFLADGNNYEIRNVVVSGNVITNSGGTALRLIGAQDVAVTGNTITNSARLVSIDDSTTFHPTWYSQNIEISGNSFDRSDWLLNRSDGTGLLITGNYTDGRDPDSAELPDSPAEAQIPQQSDTPDISDIPEAQSDIPEAPLPISVIAGTSSSESLKGTVGDNVIDGKEGRDKIHGDDGADVLIGGRDNDSLTGGGGVDRLSGGHGDDTFLFENVAQIGKGEGLRDVVTDFVHDDDRIDLSRMDANGALSGDVSFKFIATAGAAFSGRAGSLTWSKETDGNGAAVTLIKGDLNGDHIADFEIELTGHVNLTSGDFNF